MPSRRRTALLALGSAVAAAALLGAPAVALGAPGDPGSPRYGQGSDGAGDPYFPLAGNGGTDVVHYDLDLDYTPPRPGPGAARGPSRRRRHHRPRRRPQDLSRFNLDLRGLTATEVTVAGKPMTFTQTENELVITPTKKVKAGKRTQVVVTYGGTTIRPTDIEGALYGWVTTRDGAMVVSEPDGSATWFPVNDHPTDKATSPFEITVPEGLVAVANGLPSGPADHGRRQDDVVLGRARPDGGVPRDGQRGRLRGRTSTSRRTARRSSMRWTRHASGTRRRTSP